MARLILLALVLSVACSVAVAQTAAAAVTVSAPPATAGRRLAFRPVASPRHFHHWWRIAIIGVSAILGVIAILAYHHNNRAQQILQRPQFSHAF